jgi:hypothetical protein
MKTNINYKSKINEMKENRERYFPLIETLLYAESRTERRDLPLKITDVSQIALAMELMDIGYVNKEAFLIEKNRRDITGFFYIGGYPLTEAGVKVYRQHLHDKRGKLIRRLMLISLAVLAVIVFYMITR